MVVCIQLGLLGAAYPWVVDWGNTRGDFFSNSGKFSEAIVHYNRVLFLSPNNLYALIWCGYSYEDLDDLKAAENYYRKAIQKHSNQGDGYYFLAVLLMRNRKYKEAENYMREAARLPGGYQKDARLHLKSPLG
jgi:tetratricopeptide (TPR) repeat protein